MVRFSALLATALLGLAAVGAASAHATFPGRNGPVAYLMTSADKVAFSAWVLDTERPSRFVLDCSWRERLGNLTGDCVDAGGLAVTPDGRELAVSTVRGLGASGRAILQILPAGGGPATQVPLPDRGPEPYFDYRRPRWSPDAQKLLVERTMASPGGAAPHGIVMVDRDGSNAHLIDSGGTAPDWSVRGDIVFVRDGNLYATSPESPPRRLTWRGAARPSWSPDGRSIAFDRGCPQPPDISSRQSCSVYRIRVTGGKAKLVARNASAPAWSPDGRQIAFLREKKSSRDPDASIRPFLARIGLRTGKSAYLLRRVFSESDHDSMSGPEWLPR